MSVSSLNLYDQDGRIHGHYVYMLLCQDAKVGPIYVKIGITTSPIQRFRALRCGCPVQPRIFAYFDARTKTASRRIESSLHAAYAGWNAHLEWFCFTEADKSRFNEIRQAVISANTNGPVQWNKISVRELIRIGERNKRFSQRLFATRGPAYQAFIKDQAAC
jgi:hypothetical protein